MTAKHSDVILERMMSLHPKSIDLTLDRMWRLLAATGHPERQLSPVIHAAGTNGKGSTLAMIRAGLEASGQVVHAYTSPHLVRFHERIRVAGEFISEADLARLLDECWDMNDREPITYFEITTVAAFLAFSRTPSDWTLLEVGLGGRLDATNVIEKPRLTVITPVDYDHQQFLGETLEEIAFEKAGILKPGVRCIVGPQHDTAMTVIERQAARVGAPLLCSGEHWHVREEFGRLVYEDETGLVDVPMPKLRGEHQYYNAGAAIAALRFLGFGAEAAEAAMTDVYWPARMQRLHTGPLIQDGLGELWLDGGHNASAGHALASVLKSLPEAETHFIVGMLKTKDTSGFLAPLVDLASSIRAVDIPGEAATLPAAETARIATDLGADARVAPSVGNAVSEIRQLTPDARIVICGSLYLAGAVLAENA